MNTGQSCIAAKRFIVADEIYDALRRAISSGGMRALKVGDPLDPATEIGPLATEQILQGVDEQVKSVGGRRRDAVVRWPESRTRRLFLRTDCPG